MMDQFKFGVFRHWYRFRGGFRIGGVLAVLFIILGVATPASAQDPRSPAKPSEEKKSAQTVPEVVSRDTDLKKPVTPGSGRKKKNAEPGQDKTVTDPSDLARPASGSERKAATNSEQQQMLLFLDVLTKTEQRAQGLRKELFEMIEKKNSITTRIQQIEYSLRPGVISSYTALSGSLRPEDLRAQRKRNLEIEKRNLENLLERIESGTNTLEADVQKADALVEKVRRRFQKLMEKTLSSEIP